MVREEDDFFIEEDVLLLEGNFVVPQVSVMWRLALGGFLFDHDVVVEEDDVFVEDGEGWLEQVDRRLEQLDGRLEQLDGRLEEKVLAIEAKFEVLLAERGWLGKSASLSTLPDRRDT